MNENNSGLLNYIELLKSHEAALKNKLLAGDKSKSDRWLFIGLVGMVLVSFGAMGGYMLIKPSGRWLIDLSIVLIALSYVVLILMPIIKIYQQRNTIKYFFTMPLSASVEQNIKKEALTDERFLADFVRLGKPTLELGLLEIKHEREFLSKRINLIVGPVDKLGILPGIISMVITLAKPVAGHDWVMGLAYGYIGLVVLSLSFINLLVKYDRVILLTEVALSRCDEVKGDVQG